MRLRGSPCHQLVVVEEGEEEEEQGDEEEVKEVIIVLALSGFPHNRGGSWRRRRREGQQDQQGGEEEQEEGPRNSWTDQISDRQQVWQCSNLQGEEGFQDQGSQLLKGEGAPDALPWYSDARKVMFGQQEALVTRHQPTDPRWILRVLK